MRPAQDGDQQAIAEMLNACEQAYFGAVETPLPGTLEWIDYTWKTDGFDLAADSLVAVAPDEHIIGYVTVWRTEQELQRMIASPRIHPDYRARGLGSWMLHWAEQRARQISETLPQDRSATLSSWVENIDEAARELLDHEGFAPKNYLWNMQVEMEAAPPAPVWHDGFHVRNFVPGQDERAIYEVLFEAFSTDNYDPYDTFEEWVRFYNIASEDFDPSLWFLAVGSDGEIAGIVLSEPGQDGKRGWINEVAVRPQWRKHGLALALLHHALGEYYQRGIHKCALAVDAANPTGATRLYERAGMQPDNRTKIFYRKELHLAVL